MVKAKVDAEANDFIEHIRDNTDMNKTEAVAYILNEVGRADAFKNELETRMKVSYKSQ